MSLLARLAERARRNRPECNSISAAELGAFIAARVPVIDEDVRAEDLLLACACAKGVRAAHDRLHEVTEHDIERAHARIRPPFSLQRAHQIIAHHFLYIP